MTKLNVNEIEATSTNTNVKVVPKGADATCEIKGTDDGILQLNCSAQSHGVKLKGPVNSANQNYTIILPDNAPSVTTTEPTNSNLTSAKLFKVKSITGSGASAVGQLEFADQIAQDLTTLDAGNLTSGTLPTARVPAFSGSDGAGLELISKTVTGPAAVTSVSITGLSNDGMYRLIGRNIHLSTNYRYYIKFLDSNGNVHTGTHCVSQFSYNGSGTNSNYIENFMNANHIVGERYGDVDSYAFIADFATKAQANWMIWEGMAVGTIQRNVTSFATMNSDTTEIRGIKFEPTGGVTIQADSEFCLYQYRES
tara:strand:+ start:504 stop:1433 length:930 start_codon:yes stop_codon:yes gene_type:complete